MKINQNREFTVQKVKITSAIAFGCTLLALILHNDVSGIVPENCSFIPFCVSCIVCAIPIFLNSRLPKELRVRPYELGWHYYWHPYCTLLLSVGLMLFALPFQGTVLRTVKIIGILPIIAVTLWGKIYYYTH